MKQLIIPYSILVLSFAVVILALYTVVNFNTYLAYTVAGLVYFEAFLVFLWVLGEELMKHLNKIDW